MTVAETIRLNQETDETLAMKDIEHGESLQGHLRTQNDEQGDFSAMKKKSGKGLAES